MPCLDEQINKELDEQLQRVKNELITFNSLQNIIDKLEVLENDVDQLKNRIKCKKKNLYAV